MASGWMNAKALSFDGVNDYVVAVIAGGLILLVGLLEVFLRRQLGTWLFHTNRRNWGLKEIPQGTYEMSMLLIGATSIIIGLVLAALGVLALLGLRET